ncbi:hypothetical protein AMECASPLE_000880 [Ameca splendens]|uniref:Zona pellucida sperm-binding protein 1/4 Ig-like domain-containing protein n=1 Tax=Ameca splendens TaxID=208324 RepID=A0ABV0YX52_9TELE
MGWPFRQLAEKGDWQKMAMESLLKMESKVECTQDSMKLLVHDVSSTPASLIFVDRGHLSPLSLTKLPSSCGYTIRSTQKDLVLVAPYDGCFVIIQENYYVLPLLWWGLPVRLSCPLMGHVPQNPPMVTCHAEGMVVKTDWPASASKIKANVNGNWESLLTAAHRCIFGIVEHPDGVVISVRYAPCLMKKDGMYTLELAADVETKSFDFYPKPKATTKPNAVTLPQQLQLPQGPTLSQPLYPYHLHTQPKPPSRPTDEPQTLQLMDSKGQDWQQMCFYSQLLAENQLASIPTKTAEEQVYGPCQQLQLPAVEPSQVSSLGNLQFSHPPVANSPQNQVKYPFNIFHYLQKPQSAQLSSAAEANEQKIDSLRSKHDYPLYCPAGVSKCCLQMAFHQHLHISAPGDGKAEPQFYTSFLPVPYSGFSQGLETAEIPHKLSAAAVLPAVRTSAPAQIFPRAPQTADAILQPDGNAPLPRSGFTMIASQEQEPVHPYFGSESPNPQWRHVAPNVELSGLEQGKPDSPDDRFKLWASSNGQVEPVVQYEPFKIQFPEHAIHSRPNYMSYLGQHGLHIGEQENTPALEQQSLHKTLSHHNFKRAIDRFFSPYYMSGDSPVANYSVGPNSSQEQPSETGSKNSIKLDKMENLHSELQSYVLLEHGPPGREPNRFKDSQVSFREFAHGANSKALKLPRQNAGPQTSESLQEKRREPKRLREGTSSHPPGNINYMQRDGDTSTHFSDSNSVNSYTEQSFSAEQLNPEVLKSFESLWKSMTPSDFSQLFLAHVPGKTELFQERKNSALNQLAKEMDKPLRWSKNKIKISFL